MELSAPRTDLSGALVKVLFASGSDAVVASTIARIQAIMPDLPLVVVSGFLPPQANGSPITSNEAGARIATGSEQSLGPAGSESPQ